MGKDGVSWRSERVSRYEAERFADAAGELWMRRDDGFASRSLIAIPRGALAKARHPWAILRSPFGAGVERGGLKEDSVGRTCAFGSVASGQEERRLERDLLK